jgi:serine/threonine protein kinase
MPPLIAGRGTVERAGFRVKWDQPIARGKTGAAYLGVNVKTGQEVVVKESSLASHEGRVMAAASGRSKYLPDLYLDATQGLPGYLVMERGGLPLREHLGKKLEPRHAVEIARNILDGLKAVHEAGYLHLDDHPLNVLVRTLTPDPDPVHVLVHTLNPETVRVIDFGGAVPMHNGKGQTSAFHGRWRAPEMLGPWGQQVTVGPPADLYSVGLMLGQLVTGKLPVDVPDAQLQNYALRREVAQHPDLTGVEDAELKKVLQKALAYDPDQRYATAQEFIDALAPWPPR